MNDDEHSSCRTHPEKDEAIFFLRVFGIIEQARMRIVEDALGFFKPNSVLGSVALILSLIPLERSIHLDSI